MKISCLIIDDEPLARKRLLTLVAEMDALQLLGQCKTGKEAIESIEELQPDLIFLDIQMKDMNGFDVLKKLKTNKKPKVIFVTAFDTYAVKAFDAFALDYLLKPFKKERFEQAVIRAKEQFKSETKNSLEQKFQELLQYIETEKSEKSSTAPKSKLPVKTGNTVSFIPYSEIQYILASGSYVEICTADKKHVLRDSLQNVINEMESRQMLRIHRSTIINTAFLDKVIHSNFGEIDVKMKDGSQFRVSKSYRKEFQNKLGI
ncbi:MULTISPECIES: LytR/AlgR family response regulator transcription factor [Aequorivita]|uniref:Response regulator transcription factor n=1 Tax=Aequorivita iocasae TaxID=2803865 RepID=A0ABX7DSE8_9FLAO|nr:MULTISPECIES: LytTR family DNA-binding domain-containing protein [Aequorivita]QQX77075.1 response regulator transcription factor [Aequorivita iocasae]UCA56556.1 LytTR family DNA-binding domain-containing protein [Aequorivita sp. F7]